MEKARIISVVVAYNPEAYFEGYIGPLMQQVQHTIIIDNSTATDAISCINAIGSRTSHITIIRPGGNIGLAVAQNQGLRLACDMGADWILMMDDDSLIPDGMVAKMLEARLRQPNPESIGMLAPCVADKNSERIGSVIVSKSPWHVGRISPVVAQNDCNTALTVIASGSLVSADVVKKIGLYKDVYFIDSIDVEYSLRLRKAGWKILVVRDAVLKHELGQKSLHRFMGINFITTNHVTWRRYTMYRNRVDVWKNYITRFPAYVGYDMLVAIFELIKVALFEQNAWAKIINAGRGIRHGLMGYFDNGVLFSK